MLFVLSAAWFAVTNQGGSGVVPEASPAIRPDPGVRSPGAPAGDDVEIPYDDVRERYHPPTHPLPLSDRRPVLGTSPSGRLSAVVRVQQGDDGPELLLTAEWKGAEAPWTRIVRYTLAGPDLARNRAGVGLLRRPDSGPWTAQTTLPYWRGYDRCRLEPVAARNLTAADLGVLAAAIEWDRTVGGGETLAPRAVARMAPGERT